MEMTEKTFVCPRCEFPLVPVHAATKGRRRIVALTCPEPYCDHMQLLAPRSARAYERLITRRRAGRDTASEAS